MNNAWAEFKGVKTLQITGTAEFTGANTLRDLNGEQDFPGGVTGIPGGDVTIATMTLPSISTLTLTNAHLAIASFTALGSVFENGSILGSRRRAVDGVLSSRTAVN